MDYNVYADGYDTLPTGDYSGVDTRGLIVPAGASREDYYRDPDRIDVVNGVDLSHVSSEHKLLAKWIREKMHGIDVRESLARLVELVSSDLYDSGMVAKELKELSTRLEKEWNATVNALTQDSEVINARIDTKGLIQTTLKQRIDSEVSYLTPTEKLLEIQHNLFTYPTIRCMKWEYGLGLTPIGEEPEGLFGGTDAKGILSNVTYQDRNHLTVFVTKENAMTSPTVTKLNTKTYLLTEGTSSVQIFIGGE